MIAAKGSGMIHVNAADVQPLIDEGGYEFFDDEHNPIDDLDAYIKKEIEAHTGYANSYEELIEQLKAQGVKGD